jgi:hypothetical protein
MYATLFVVARSFLPWLSASAAVALTVMALGACEERIPTGVAPHIPHRPGDGGSGGGLFNMDEEECTVPEGACGHEVRKIQFDGPNLYFVFDRSGSMADAATPGGVISRYSAVRSAAIEMVEKLGALINVGAAVFPGTSDSCAAGQEVMDIRPGDPKSKADDPESTTTIFKAHTMGTPSGGTPISATLEGLVSTLSEADGETVVMLLTDGGPNCNGSISCGASECQPIVEGTCPLGDNCCDPSYPGGGPELCIDRTATVDAVAAIAELGIDVYVIGIPGSEIYEDVLDEMAVAGGTAKMDSPQYHQVTDLAGIGDVFASIAADAISCQLPLSDTPTEEDKSFTNVYLDCELLPYDPVNGWGWLEDDTVWLHGEACDKLKSGDVAEVHIAIGCPTEVPK